MIYKIKGRFPLFLLFSLGFLFISLPAWPQDLPSEIAFEEAAVTEQRIIEEKKDTLEDPVKEPEVEVEREEPESRGPELRFFNRNIELIGHTLLTNEKVRSLINPYEDQEITVSRLNELAREIEAAYREKGFISAFVYLPPQEVENETVILEVIEGRISQINIEGNEFFEDGHIMALLDFEEDEVVNYESLRSTLRRLNRNPDIIARLVLKAGEDPKTTDITFTIKDRFPVHLGASFDNGGSKTIGYERYGFSLRHNNVTGKGDVLLGGLVFNPNLGVIYGQYLWPVPGTPFKWIYGSSYAQALPKKNLEPFGVNSYSVTTFGRLRTTLFERQDLVVDFDVGMDYKESRTRLLSRNFRRDQLRIFQFGPEIVFLEPSGYTRFKSDFSFGTKAFGAGVHIDEEAARQGVDASFFRYRGHLQRNQQLAPNQRYELKAQFQVPSNKLPSQEAIYLGGASSVRGYPEGDYLADSGVIVNFDYFLRVHPHVEWGGFVDNGYGRLRGPSDTETKDRYQIGVGTGLRFEIFPNIFARVEWGAALGAFPLTEAGRTQFHFRLEAKT